MVQSNIKITTRQGRNVLVYVTIGNNKWNVIRLDNVVEK